MIVADLSQNFIELIIVVKFSSTILSSYINLSGTSSFDGNTSPGSIMANSFK